MPLVLKGVMQSPVTPLKKDFSPDLARYQIVESGGDALSDEPKGW